MAEVATAISSSSSAVAPPENHDKPVIVRVKRKSFHSPVEAFWLAINERPSKRRLLDDLHKLSISSTNSSSKVEELKTKKVLVRHVETVSSSEASVDILHSFVSSSDVAAGSKAKVEERMRAYKADHKQGQLLGKAKEKQEVFSRNSRFEQIWRSRRGIKDAPGCEALREKCHLYDVVLVDDAETSRKGPEHEDLDDYKALSSFLPLLREFIPSAAEEIESDMGRSNSKQASEDDYVYDVYAMNDVDTSMMEEDASNMFPLVQVDDADDFYDGPDRSEFESDDSNAEDNPLNDYPDEETSEEEDEIESSDDKSEVIENESNSENSSECASENLTRYVENMHYDDHGAGMNDSEDGDYDEEDDRDGRWSYR